MNLFGRYIVGIDVGISGFAAILNIDTFAVEFHPLPVKYYPRYVKDKNGERKKLKSRRIDENRMRTLIRTLAKPMVEFFVLEHQQPFPGGQGVASTAKIVGAYNLIKGMIMMTSTPVEVVRPVVWKRALGLVEPRAKKGQIKIPETTYQKKVKAWKLCVHLFPELLNELSPKSYNFDRAEAVLLAYFGLQFRAKDYGIREPAA